jgi:hypothetical protein
MHLLLIKPPLVWYFMYINGARFSPHNSDDGLRQGQPPQANVATDALADRLQPVGIGVRAPMNQIDVRRL